MNPWIMVIFFALSFFEMVVSNGMDNTILLWIGYGAYKIIMKIIEG